MYFKTGDRGSVECNELNYYYFKAVSGRPVIMHILLWERSYTARHIQ